MQRSIKTASGGLLLPLLVFAAALEAGEAVVIITGEAHGSLFPCRICPLEAGGGLAQRATLLRKLCQQYPAHVVINVGGDAAGGPHDAEYQDAPDAAGRTELLMRSLALMPLDAYAAGDEELAYGRQLLTAWSMDIPLVSGNCRWEGREEGVSVSRAGVDFHVTALTRPPDWFMPGAEAAAAEMGPPEKATVTFPATDALKVLVCHLGEPATLDVLSRLRAAGAPIDLAINAHSRRDPRNLLFVAGVPVVQFPALGREIRSAHLAVQTTAGGRRTYRFSRLDTHRLDDGVRPDAAVARILENYAAQRAARTRRISLVFFKMPLCPYAPAVERKLLDALPELRDAVDFEVRYVTSEDAAGRPGAPRGTAELEESRVQAAVREFFPEAFPKYLSLRLAQPETAWPQLARSVGVPPARIRGAIAIGEAEAFLARDRAICRRYGVLATPAILVGERLIDAPPVFERAVSHLCRLLAAFPPSPPGEGRGEGSEISLPAVCAKVPACFSDADCRQPGLEGECVNAGTLKAECRTYPAAPAPLTIVYPEHALASGHQRTLEALREFFPGLQARLVPFPSDEAEELLRDYPFDLLPAYLAGASVADARGFRETAENFQRLPGGGFALDPRASAAGFFYKRPRHAGELRIFVPPATETGRQALATLWEYLEHAAYVLPGQAGVQVLPLLTVSDGKAVAVAGAAGTEEALRMLAVMHKFPERYLGYLAALAASGGTGYWEEPVEQAGLDAAAVKAASRSEPVHALALEAAGETAALLLPQRVAVVFENREVLLPADRGEFLDIIMAAAPRVLYAPSARQASREVAR